MKSYVTWCLLLLGMTGCGRPPLLRTVPATGTLLYRDKPVEDAWVVFFDPLPDARSAIALTDSNGRFVLETPYAGSTFVKGAMPSDYIVLAGKPSPDQRDIGLPMSPDQIARLRSLPPAKKASNPEEAAEIAAAFQPMPDVDPASRTLLPFKYADIRASDLRASVVAGEKNDFTFRLSD